MRRGEEMSESRQQANIRRAVKALAPMIHDGHQLLITHGNGPQVGMIALQNMTGPPEGRCGLDVIGAQSQGMIGYMIEQEVRNILPPGRSCATLLTQVAVRSDDAAFQRFEKPIGPDYTAAEADVLRRERGWTFVRDKDLWRRAVPSPRPQEIMGLDMIRKLADSGAVVICLGGGGVPVVKDKDGMLRGIEAVIDKDHASSLLARAVSADALALLTDVEGVFDRWNTAEQTLMRVLAPDDIDLDMLEAGSMRPKVAAACDFVRATGNRCAIGRMEEAPGLLSGTAGTQLCAVTVSPDNGMARRLSHDPSAAADHDDPDV